MNRYARAAVQRRRAEDWQDRANGHTGYSAESEEQFQARVIELATLCGWLYYHTFDSRRSPAGFLDLVLAHAKWGKLLIVELKTDKGKLSDSQRVWLGTLMACGVDARVWRPADWPEIERTLTGRNS